MPTLAREFNISLSTVHVYIEEQRKLLRAQTIDLAAQERDQALELLDNAIEKVVPHIDGEVSYSRHRSRANCPRGRESFTWRCFRRTRPWRRQSSSWGCA